MSTLETIEDAIAHVGGAVELLRRQVEREDDRAVRHRILRALVELTAAQTNLAFARIGAEGTVLEEVPG